MHSQTDQGFYNDARRLSDRSFAAAQREVEAFSNYVVVHRIFSDAVLAVTRNIPEEERTPEDNLRIMRSYQHTIQYLSRGCGISINTYNMQRLRGEHQKTDGVREILDVLNRLRELTDKAADYLERGQKGMLAVDVNFYLAASTGLLDYYESMAEWNVSRDLPLDIRLACNQGEYSPTQYVERVSADFIRNIILPKMGVSDVNQLRDLTSCYHSIANIYKCSKSLHDCLKFVMLAIDANNAIPAAYKTDQDATKFVTIYVTLANVIYKKNPLLESITEIANGFFGSGTNRATPESLDAVFKAASESSAGLEEQQLLLQLMHVIYDNYQLARFTTKLQLALQEPVYHAKFKEQMHALEQRIAEHDRQEVYVPKRRM